MARRESFIVDGERGWRRPHQADVGWEGGRGWCGGEDLDRVVR